MTYTATINNPEYNYTAGVSGASATVSLSSFEHPAAFASISIADALIEYDVLAVYANETTASNPVQLNSTVIVKRDSDFIFRGYIADKPIIIEDGGRRYVHLQIEGTEAVLLKTLVTDASGNNVWGVRSSSFTVGAAAPMSLQPTTVFGSFVGATLWPDPGTAEGAKCYIQDSDSPTDTIDAQILNTDVAPFTITFTTTNKGFPAYFWLKIGTEWFYCEGYDDTGTGGKYRTLCIARAQLGTSAATHAASATAYAKVAKKIAPEVTHIYQTIGADTNELRNGSDYFIQSNYGCFVLSGSATGTYTGVYDVYDEDQVLNPASVVYLLEDVIELMVTAPITSGGAGFASGDCDFDSSDAFGNKIAITRYDYDPERNEVYAWNAIFELISALGLEEEVQFWYDHTTGKLKLRSLLSTAASLSFGHADRVEREFSLTDLVSGVRASYTNDQDINRAMAPYSYHQAATGLLLSPDSYISSTNAPGWQDNGATQTHNSAGSGGMSALFDGSNSTKLRGEFTHDPGSAPINFDFGHFWFGSGTTPPAISLDKIKITVNDYRVITPAWQPRSNAELEYVVKLEGCTDYDTTSNTGTWFDIGCEMRKKPSVNGTNVQAEWTSFSTRIVNAVRIVFVYMAGYKTGNTYVGAVHEFLIEGSSVSYLLIQTSDTEQNNPYYVYAPDAHQKLRGGVGSSGSAGAPRIEHLSVGVASELAAITLARTELKARLKLYQQRHYVYRGEYIGKPELGMTIEVDEDGDGSADYTGIVREYTYSVSGNETEISFVILDYGASDVA